MKNIQKYAMVLLSCMAAAGMACSCTADWLREEDYPMAPGTGDTPVLTFDGEDALTVDNDGGDYSFSFTANLPWMIESRSSWITITSDHKGMGGSEPVTVTYNVSRNGTVDPREGSIRVWITDDAEYFVTISQEATPLEELGNNWYVKVGGTGDGSSWANATTLSDALASAADNDNIYVAAGTHYPTSMIPGGSSTRDNTFYVGANVSITGGFPVDAQEGAVADPSANPTILSGDFDGGPAYHVMVVAAPKSDLFSVHVSGLTLTGGSAAASAQTLTINGAGFHRSYGAGLSIGNTRATFENCIISGNESTEASSGFNAGVYNTDYAETHLINCVIKDNESTGNGGGIWNCATLYMDGCTVRNNVSNGVGAGLYNFYWNKGAREVNAYVYNTAFINNRTDGSKNSRRGGGYYGREQSKAVLANCTFDGNYGGNGAAVSLYGTAALPSQLTMISCTVTNNTSTFTGGGVEATDNTTLNVYNTIVAGNTDALGYPDLVVTSGNNGTSNLPATLAYSVNGSVVYGANGTVVSGSTFEFETMLSALNDGVRALTGSDNPALTGGMAASALVGITTGMNPEVDTDVLRVDQKGNDRTGSAMGAYVGN